MPKRYKNWDVVDKLKTPEDVAGYLNAVLEEGNEKKLMRALGDAVLAVKGMSQVAKEAGLSRQALYKGLSENGNPKVSSLFAVLRSVGLEFSVRPLAQKQGAEKPLTSS